MVEAAPTSPNTPPPLPPRELGAGKLCRCAPHPKAVQWERELANRSGWAKTVEDKRELSLRIFSGTWNVAGRIVEDASALGEWLDVDSVQAGQKPPDLFAIGFQEVIDLSAGNVVLDSFLDTQSRANAQRWLALIKEYFVSYGDKHGTSYTLITDQRLLGTYMIVFAESSLAKQISGVQRAFVATGVGGRLGNKGVVAVRLVLAKEVTLCLACCHMAAHREYVLQRNEEYRIVTEKKLFFKHQAGFEQQMAAQALVSQRMGGLAGLASYAAAAATAAVAATAGSGTISPRGDDVVGGLNTLAEPPSIGILQHDVVIWLGDMNYRIGGEVTAEDVGKMVANGQLEELRKLDQLSVERAAGRAFSGFFEGILTFPPTYKLISGTRDYDLRPEKKMRCPAWCDRILYCIDSASDTAVQSMRLIEYVSTGPALSDHLPVRALFSCQLKYNNPDQDRAMVDRLMREWEVWSQSQSDEAAVADAAAAAESNDNASTTAGAGAAAAQPAAGLLVEAAPPALTVRGVTRDSVISFFVQLMTVPPAASGSNIGSSNGSSSSDTVVQQQPALQYHVCDSSVPPWIRLRNASGTLTGSPTEGLIELEIDSSKMAFRYRDGGNGWLPACAMLVVALEPKPASNGSKSSSSSPVQSPRMGGSAAVRRIIIPVLCTLKDDTTGSGSSSSSSISSAAR